CCVLLPPAPLRALLPYTTLFRSLEADPRRRKGDFLFDLLIRPTGQHADVFGGDRFAVVLSGGRLEQDLDGEGQTGDVSEALFLQALETPVNIGASIHFQGGADVEPIIAVCHGALPPLSVIGRYNRKRSDPFRCMKLSFFFRYPLYNGFVSL